MFSEETDWLHRFRAAGWKVMFFPGAEVAHVGGASHGGRLSVENLRGILRFLAKTARRALRAGADPAAVVAAARGARVRASAEQRYRDGARFLASGDVSSPARVSGSDGPRAGGRLRGALAARTVLPGRGRNGSKPFRRSGYPPPAPMRSSLIAKSLRVCHGTAPTLHRFVHRRRASA